MTTNPSLTGSPAAPSTAPFPARKVTGESPATSLPTAHEEQLAALLDDYVSRLERGERPSVDALLAEHPELAGELAEYLDGVRMIHAALHDAPPAPHVKAIAGAAEQPPRDAPPQVLGDYELGRELGRGGMGIVYEARQLSLNRQVALKVLPFAAVLDQRQIARFRNEAQAAAQLHHPHIVPVYAVGHERGIHFYAMQLIEGQSLHQAIADLRVARGPVPTGPHATTAPDATTIAAAGEKQGAQAVRPTQLRTTLGQIHEKSFFQTAATLGMEAAEALAHAHDLGIVHRDIKPSNLMLDRQGKLWITDFGLARVQSELGVTHTGDIVGTLRYMSPEQARGRADRVDGRSDIYALGATLYELLTLQPAFPEENHAELLAQISHTEPRRLRDINPAIPADLENVVLRAMDKDRERRYATAEEFARDLRCFIEGKPTIARPPTLVDRFGKWVRRRQKLVAAAGVVLVLLTGAATISAVLIARANHQTQAAAQVAEQNLQDALRVIDHFGGELADRMADVPGAEPFRMELLRDTQAYYEHLLSTTSADVRGELASTHFRSAEVAAKLGDFSTAEREYAAALIDWRRELDASPGDRLLLQRIAMGEHQFGTLCSAHGRADEARQHYSTAAELREQLAAAQPEETDAGVELAETLINLGLLEFAANETAVGIAHVRQGTERLSAARRLQPNDESLLRRLAVARNSLSFVLRDIDPPGAIRACQQAALELAQLVQRTPPTAQTAQVSRRADLAMTQNNLGALAGRAGDWATAAKYYQLATDQLTELVRREPLNPARRRELAIAGGNAAVALVNEQDWERAAAEFADARDVLATLAADYPSDPRYPDSQLALHNNYALALRDEGRLPQALEVLQQLAPELAARPASPLIDTFRRNLEAIERRLSGQPNSEQPGATQPKQDS